MGPGPAGGVEVAFVDHFGLEMFSREMWTRRRLIANCHWELEVGRGFKVGFTHTHARTVSHRLSRRIPEERLRSWSGSDAVRSCSELVATARSTIYPSRLENERDTRTDPVRLVLGLDAGQCAHQEQNELFPSPVKPPHRAKWPILGQFLKIRRHPRARSLPLEKIDPQSTQPIAVVTPNDPP